MTQLADDQGSIWDLIDERVVRRGLAIVLVVAAIVAAFQVGYVNGINEGKHITIRVGDGRVGEDFVSLCVRDTCYAASGDIDWTDQSGTVHTGGWPECLPKLTVVQGVRFAGDILWAEDHGAGIITWIDCRRR